MTAPVPNGAGRPAPPSEPPFWVELVFTLICFGAGGYGVIAGLFLFGGSR